MYVENVVIPSRGVINTSERDSQQLGTDHQRLSLNLFLNKREQL